MNDRPQEPGPTRWLDEQERAAWISLCSVVTRLPTALDAQLQRDADLTFFEYMVLALLAEEPSRTLRMSALARITHGSLSRLSHVAKRLEARGLLRRERCPQDGRFTNALLTDLGHDVVVAAAPGHVAHARRLVVDALDPAALGQLRAACERISDRIDPAAC